ncbi:PREDICTED: protein SUPPRESSOR OF npr1-1, CONSTITUTIVE 1-like [Fragaria vesca subsp. vesca]
MGREIIRLESTREPGKRSRLWSHEDVNHILTQNTATDAVECLMLDLSNSKVDLCINREAFVRMKKLRLLIIYHSHYSIFDSRYYYIWGGRWSRSIEDIYPVDGCKQVAEGDLGFLSHELRFLLWHGCPLKSLPSNFIPQNLVRLHMRAPAKSENHLVKSLPIPCQNPDLTEAINLEKLMLDGCSTLIEVHSSIYALQKLDYLNLKGCKELKNPPSSIHMKSLKTLDISGCLYVGNFPEISHVVNELKELYLDGTVIKELRSSIDNLTGLYVLDLSDCTELMTLPTSIHMKSLVTLRLSGCSNVEKFPEISEIMKKLAELHLDGTAIKGLPSSIGLLEGLKRSSMRNCKSLEFLPNGICNLVDLKDLNLSNCSALHNLPERNWGS